MIDPRRHATFALLMSLAWLLLSAQLLLEYWPATGLTLPDADDAMRLVGVREFLAGRGWFDLHEARLGLASGYATHWSRLIDAGLAGVFLLFRTVTDSHTAERLMTAAWPLLWLLPVIAGVAAVAWRIAGREAAVIVLLLAIFAGPGIQQFRPGRIDHHNVQIALSLLVVAATVWSDRSRHAAWVAGVLSGLVLSIGFEGLPLVSACAGALVCQYVLSGEPHAMRRYGVALAVGTAAVLLISAPVSIWSVSVCDRLAINSVSALGVAGLGVAVLPVLAPDNSRTIRAALVLAVGIVALVVFAAFEPRCLGGHYAMIDPAVRPVWLDHVSETMPLAQLFAQAAATGVATLAFPLAALIAAVVLLRERADQREFGPLTAAAMLAVSFAYMVVAVRGVSYVVWLGMPFIAAIAVDLFGRMKLDNLALRFAVVIVMTPTALTLGAMTLATAAGQRELTELNTSERATCTSRAEYEALAALPPGRVAVNEIEWGPYILAWTPHSVLAAPYHRLAPAILASHRVFALPPERSREVAADARVDYIVVCGSHGANGVAGMERTASLWGRLQSRDTPGWLERVGGTGAFEVYRVRP
jgi:hypothetical protein